MTANSALTAKQEAFVVEYLVDFNATQAAIRAGFSVRSAKSMASQLLSREPIARAVSAAKAERTHGVPDDVTTIPIRIDPQSLAAALTATGRLTSNSKKALILAVEKLVSEWVAEQGDADHYAALVEQWGDPNDDA